MEKSVVLSTILSPAYVPSAVEPLDRLTLPFAAANGIKNESNSPF